MARLLTAMVLAGSIVTPAAAQQQADTLISISAGSVERGGFIPRPVPYSEGGPAVSVYLIDHKDVRTTDGLVITGFEFIGWTEGDGTRIQVFALVPRKGAPNTYLPNGDGDLLERRDFASYRIFRDQGIAIGEMRDLGVDPMIIRAGPVPARVAEYERLREAAEQLRQTLSDVVIRGPAK